MIPGILSLLEFSAACKAAHGCRISGIMQETPAGCTWASGIIMQETPIKAVMAGTQGYAYLLNMACIIATVQNKYRR